MCQILQSNLTIDKETKIEYTKNCKNMLHRFPSIPSPVTLVCITCITS